MRKHDVNMLSGSITKGLWRISLPIMIMNLMSSLFSIIDMTILKNFCTDGNAVGAVGVCSSLIALLGNLVIGITTGTNPTTFAPFDVCNRSQVVTFLYRSFTD